MQKPDEATTQVNRQDVSYLRIFVANSLSLSTACAILGSIYLISKFFGQPQTAQNVIAFSICVLITIPLYLFKSPTYECYLLSAWSSMGPFAAILGQNLLGWVASLVWLGMFFCFLLRPRTVWQVS